MLTTILTSNYSPEKWDYQCGSGISPREKMDQHAYQKLDTSDGIAINKVESGIRQHLGRGLDAVSPFISYVD